MFCLVHNNPAPVTISSTEGRCGIIHIKISTCRIAELSKIKKFPFMVTILSQVAFSSCLTAFISNLG